MISTWRGDQLVTPGAAKMAVDSVNLTPQLPGGCKAWVPVSGIASPMGTANTNREQKNENWSSGCSTVVKCTPCNCEVTGLIPSERWASSSIFSFEFPEYLYVTAKYLSNIGNTAQGHRFK